MDFLITPVIVLLALFALRILCHFASIISYRNSDRGRLPLAPEDEASWWLGHQWRLSSHDVGSEYSRWARLLGPVYRIKAALWQRDIIVVTDHLAMKHIFANPYTYTKSPELQKIVENIVGRGLAGAEGEEHKFQRRMVAPAFSMSAIKKMEPSLMGCSERMIQRIQNDCDDQGSVLNISKYIPGCTLDGIGQFAFGYDFGPDSPEGQEILKAWHDDVDILASFGVFLAPLVLGAFPWIAKLPLKVFSEETATKKVIYQVGRKLLAQPPNMQGTDIFSILHRHSWQGKSDQTHSGEKKLDDTALLDNILTIFVAGFDTTSGLVQFTLLELARQPEVQSKLRAEILAADSSDVFVIDSLPYLEAVIREGIRLNQSSQDGLRVSNKDDVIPLKNPVTLFNGQEISSIAIKAGDVFTIPFTAVNTDPAVWGSDAHLYKPERWIKEGGLPPQTSLPGGPYAGLTNFIDGPRTCIGWRLAIKEAKVMITSTIKSFELRDVGVKIDRLYAPTPQPFVHGKGAQLPLLVKPVHH